MDADYSIINLKHIIMATVLFQAGIPFLVVVALGCGAVKQKMEKKRKRALELARIREKFLVFKYWKWGIWELLLFSGVLSLIGSPPFFLFYFMFDSIFLAMAIFVNSFKVIWRARCANFWRSSSLFR